MNPVVPEVESGVDLRIRKDERREVGVTRTLIGERVLDLQVVTDARVELAVRSVQPRRPLRFAVTEHGFRRFVASHEKRENVEFGANVEVGARLDETRLF